MNHTKNHAPIVGHRTGNTVRVKSQKETGQTQSYVVDVYNAILQQESEAANLAMSSANKGTKTATEKAACAAQSGQSGCESKCQCKNHSADYGDGHDSVNHPSHYCQGGIECIDAIQAAVTSLSGMEAVCTGNVIKYVWRWKLKNGAEDLKKARFYLNKLILMTERRDKND